MSNIEERDAIVRDVMRLARDAPRDLTARVAALSMREQAEVVLRLPGRERLELLLHAPQPMRLVRSLPDSEIYFTVRDIGPFDALPLLALASADQLIHLIDLESWRADRFDGDRSGAWVALLLESGEPTILRFLRAADDDLLGLLFCLWARVREIVDEEEVEDGLLSPDGQHRFYPNNEDHARAIQRIAQILFQDDAHRYARIVRIAEWELPSQLEESTLRWRDSRLEERGFPDLDSALAVYAAPVGLSASGVEVRSSADDAITVPRSALRARASAPRVVGWLESLPPAAFERVLFELTAVANKVLVADRADTGDPAAHRMAMERAVGFVEVALAERGVTHDADAHALFAAVPVIELFRQGYARAVALQGAARRLVREGWPKLHARAMETLDAPIRAWVAALLEKRPAVHSLVELDAARHALDLAELLGRAVNSPLGWDVAGMLESLPPGATPPMLGAMWITSCARHAETGLLGPGPVTASVADAFRARLQDVEARHAIALAFTTATDAAKLVGYTTARLEGVAREGVSELFIDPR